MTVCYKCGEAMKTGDWYGLHPTCFQEWFTLPSLNRFENIASPRISQEALQHRINSSFFHGKFRKYSATLGNEKYILKIEEKDYPELPATEYLCSQIFEALGIDVPPFYFIRFEERDCFVTKNFMSGISDASLIHIYHFFERDDAYNCENLLRIIGERTGRLSAQEDFVFLTLADSLIGNNDRHGRNLGMIQTPKGSVLSPVYDNPSYLGTEIMALLGADHQPAGAIWTQASKSPTMKDYVQEWGRLGFHAVVERFRKKVSIKTLHELVEASFLTAKRKQALIRLMSKRYQELCK